MANTAHHTDRLLGQAAVISDHDYGPNFQPGVMVPIKTRPTLLQTDIHGGTVYRGNPISWLVGLTQCIPFLHFNGSGSQASQDAGAAALAAGISSPELYPGSQEALGSGTGQPGSVTSPLIGPARIQQFIGTQPAVIASGTNESTSQLQADILRARPIVYQGGQ
jgi:hypothetical protein